MTAGTTAPINRTVSVPIGVQEAFDAFTEQIGAWWPLAAFSLAREQTETALVEPRVGGRIYERARDGAEKSWATITAWEPPTRFAATWQLRPDQEPTDLEVRFVPEAGGTRVELTHGGWDRMAEGEAGRGEYDGGWEHLLGLFVEHVRHQP